MSARGGSGRKGCKAAARKRTAAAPALALRPLRHAGGEGAELRVAAAGVAVPNHDRRRGGHEFCRGAGPKASKHALSVGQLWPYL